MIEPFAAYGFNKAHAASYAIVAYHTAYMKAHFPAEYMTAIMTAESDDLEKVAEAVAEWAGMGIAVLPPDVNSSFKDFTYIDDQHIRFGLLAIKNIGSDTVENIIDERKRQGPFATIEDLFLRLNLKSLNRKSVESLIKSGAMDAFGDRQAQLDAVEAMLAYARENQKAANSNQSSLFGGATLARATIRLAVRRYDGKGRPLGVGKRIARALCFRTPVEAMGRDARGGGHSACRSARAHRRRAGYRGRRHCHGEKYSDQKERYHGLC